MANSTDWLTKETPALEYQLVAWSGKYLDEDFRIDVTFQEFENLRKYLARLRGLPIAEATPTTAAPACDAEPVPDWALNTPPEDSYDLTMFDSYGSSIEEVSLSREEYIEAKRFIAKLRNIPGTAAE